jgi:ferritin-like metal-binding protein YciE
MPATSSNIRDVYLLHLGDLLFVERRLASEVIPEMLGQISSPVLTGAIAPHLEQTKRHVRNVEQAFRAAGAETSCNQSRPFVGLTEQHSELAEAAVVPAVADLIHAQAALSVEHYEIACYRALVSEAARVAPEAVALLEENLEQEEQAGERLQDLIPELCAVAAEVTPDAVR